jgi:hypothetical protein
VDVQGSAAVHTHVRVCPQDAKEGVPRVVVAAGKGRRGLVPQRGFLIMYTNCFVFNQRRTKDVGCWTRLMIIDIRVGPYNRILPYYREKETVLDIIALLIHFLSFPPSPLAPPTLPLPPPHPLHFTSYRTAVLHTPTYNILPY